jgi:hypothetical protein
LATFRHHGTNIAAADMRVIDSNDEFPHDIRQGFQDELSPF